MSEYYTPEEDITQEGPDGVGRLVAAKGVPVPMDEAKAKGFIKEPKKAEPKEVKKSKADAPAEPV